MEVFVRQVQSCIETGAGDDINWDSLIGICDALTERPGELLPVFQQVVIFYLKNATKVAVQARLNSLTLMDAVVKNVPQSRVWFGDKAFCEILVKTARLKEKVPKKLRARTSGFGAAGRSVMLDDSEFDQSEASKKYLSGDDRFFAQFDSVEVKAMRIIQSWGMLHPGEFPVFLEEVEKWKKKGVIFPPPSEADLVPMEQAKKKKKAVKVKSPQRNPQTKKRDDGKIPIEEVRRRRQMEEDRRKRHDNAGLRNANMSATARIERNVLSLVLAQDAEEMVVEVSTLQSELTVLEEWKALFLQGSADILELKFKLRKAKFFQQKFSLYIQMVLEGNYTGVMSADEQTFIISELFSCIDNADRVLAWYSGERPAEEPEESSRAEASSSGAKESSSDEEDVEEKKQKQEDQIRELEMFFANGAISAGMEEPQKVFGVAPSGPPADLLDLLMAPMQPAPVQPNEDFFSAAPAPPADDSNFFQTPPS